jgi:hypothetical protein
MMPPTHLRKINRDNTSDPAKQDCAQQIQVCFAQAKKDAQMKENHTRRKEYYNTISMLVFQIRRFAFSQTRPNQLSIPHKLCSKLLAQQRSKSGRFNFQPLPPLPIH